MKKYLYSFLLTAFILAGLGFFYSQMVSSETTSPPFTLERVEGDADEAEGVSIRGHRYNGGGQSDQEVKVVGSPRDIEEQLSFLEQMDVHWDPLMNALQNEHRSFMRGKDNPSSLYIDDQFIIYADLRRTTGESESMMEISILDHKDEEEVSFEIDLPAQALSSRVIDVQLIESELKVTTESYTYQETNEQQQTDIDVYSINISGQSINDAETVISEPHVQMIGSDSSMPSASSAEPSDHLAFSTRSITVDEGGNEQIEGDSLLVYSYQTNQVDEVDLNLSEAGMAEFYHSDDVIDIVDTTGDIAHISTYDLGSETFTEGSRIELPIEDGWQSMSQISGERFYLLSYPSSQESSMGELHIFSVESGETLYEGRIVPVEGEATEHGQLEYYELTVEPED
ncbi:hypothetical protein [Shouchella shacheensis]|uniref:hypothetical protein n=1 Tax=Shouchella shacheensis TaxID=1649580 RepID=UPI00073FF966|nr:hypothetical protein [Shouchella shacheensis]